MRNRAVIRLMDRSFFTETDIQPRLACEPLQRNRLKSFPTNIRVGKRIKNPAIQAIRIVLLQKMDKTL